MKKIFAFVIGGLLSASAWSQGYSDQDSDYSFRTIVSVATGKAELEDVEGDVDMHSLSVALDFDRLPVEAELRYSNMQNTYTYSTYVDDMLVDQEKVDGNIDNIGVSAKLDLSWNCKEACAYLIAGYNMGEVSADYSENGEKLGSYSTDANYAHFGAGFRYDFSSNMRASIEYLQYNIGEQELDDTGGVEIDFGNATAWQAGIGYRF
ncbi:outer membrane beta-barrel protein [Microbulbifer sp.]|uniref:outer membrane protein n=1 Tax=Microbulbifer sp. TaxID=1908541 RepID=UPI0025857C19|nr:outer membrane beta-barrel protein [Microbulbifer sp.]